MDIKNAVNEILPEIISMRRELHENPELSGKEVETNNRVCKCLDKYGISYKSGIGGLGIVANITGGKPGKTIAIRADMDALPVTEHNDLSFKSKNIGVMHACGHDAHTSIMIGAGIILKKFEKELNGSVKLLFQPAEEAIGGAEKMVNEGCLENPKVDNAIGLHVMPNVPTGKIEIKYGKLNANTGSVEIICRGKSGHAAYPDTAIDAIVIAANVINTLQTLVSRSISPLNSVVLTFGKINGGEKNNIIAKEVTISGTLRTLDIQTRDKAREIITRISENVAKALGGSAEVSFDGGYIALINNDSVVDIIKETAEEVVGKENILYKEFPSLGGEDFSYISDKVPSAFFHLGCGNQEKKTTAPLHSDSFLLDEDCIRIGIEMEVRAVLNLLETNN